MKKLFSIIIVLTIQKFSFGQHLNYTFYWARLDSIAKSFCEQYDSTFCIVRLCAEGVEKDSAVFVVYSKGEYKFYDYLFPFKKVKLIKTSRSKSSALYDTLLTNCVKQEIFSNMPHINVKLYSKTSLVAERNCTVDIYFGLYHFLQIPPKKKPSFRFMIPGGVRVVY